MLLRLECFFTHALDGSLLSMCSTSRRRETPSAAADGWSMVVMTVSTMHFFTAMERDRCILSSSADARRSSGTCKSESATGTGVLESAPRSRIFGCSWMGLRSRAWNSRVTVSTYFARALVRDWKLSECEMIQ